MSNIKIPTMLVFIFVLFLTLPIDGFVAADDFPLMADPAVKRALSTLESGEYGEELGWWSADARGGREPGTAGSIEAARCAAAAFEALGLEPVGDAFNGRPSYFQFLERGGKVGLLDGHRLAVGERTFVAGKDWSLLGGCKEVELNRVQVVFAGYGITAPDLGYDDYDGIDAYGSRAPRRIGEIHNGADDNASGSVGVIELAEAFVEAGIRPKRSILFQLYDAEEKGLLGSRHYVDHPVVPLEKTTAMINLDMIAHAQAGKCSIMGTGSAAEWPAILEVAERTSTLDWSHSDGGFGGSDQSSFLQKDIPVLFFFTGVHDVYHTPDDDLERCNLEGAVDVLEVVFLTTLLVAERDEPLTFKKPEPSRRSRVKMGVYAESAGIGEEGLRITRIVTNSGAEKAGLRAGDIILSLDGTAVSEVRQLVRVIRAHKPGDNVIVRFIRGDEENEVQLVLGGS